MVQTPSKDLTVETLKWCDGHLEMIDQRLLPSQLEYLPYRSAFEVAEGIRSMVVRGAPAIGCAAAYGVALEAMNLRHASREAFDKGMETGFEILAASRPTAINLFWALERLRGVWHANRDSTTDKIADQMIAEAHEISAEDVRINRRLGSYGAALLPDRARVLTHCNAGALATAGHGTALGVIRSAVEAGKHISVVVDETRPFLQGARLTAWEMVRENIPVTLITDNMSGYMISRGEIDVVIVGTDRVTANGDVVNKIGTYMLAVLAQRHGIPFYVACPISTIDLATPDGTTVPIEERAADEVTGFRENQWSAKGVQVRNPSFDVTPADLVTALITEKGVVYQPDRVNIACLFTS
jgi:methylthioribose-1-phosphate isomerase